MTTPGGMRVFQLALVAACGLLATAMMLDRTPGASVALESIKDMDAPNSMDAAFKAKYDKMTRAAPLQALAQEPPRTSLRQKNSLLEQEVHTLAKEVSTLSQDVLHGSLAGQSRSRQNTMLKQNALRTQALVGPGNRGLSHELSDEDRESNSIFYSTSKDDPMATQSLVSAAGDQNWMNQLLPGDYLKDPYERPFLHAPGPHDPASTLAHTVTGDYASPATWGDLYEDKENIDWCTENFPWFEDRIKCIRKIHAHGPLLG